VPFYRASIRDVPACDSRITIRRNCSPIDTPIARTLLFVNPYTEKKMKTSRKVLLTIAAGVSLAATAPAFADHRDHGNHDDGDRHWHRRDEGRVYYGQPQVVYAPAPVYYGPPQVVYAPAPVYYAPAPAPVYYGQPQVVYGQPPLAYGPPPVVYSPPQPAPVYASSPNAGNVGGAIVGGVIGSRFGQGDGRLVSTAIGAVVGSMIGGGM
jgi:hypothetical protein